ncbi:hypothetical protein PROVRETT_07431 [Providencia rettgeri DSM 1131]|nr:hypothetical protein PROVRETT_07431 [Providencia rettgeri DSM 1131]
MNRKRTSQSYLLISHIKNQILLNGLERLFGCYLLEREMNCKVFR